MKTHVVPSAVLLAVLTFIGAPQLAAQRSGFIIGFGAGLGITSLSANGQGDSRTGLGTDLRIGAQVSEKVQVYYANRVVFTGDDFADLLATGLSGVGVTYIPTDSKVMISGAMGIGVLTVLDADAGETDTETGFGLSGGVGYEFSPHWLVDGTLTWARIGQGFGSSLRALTFRFGLSVLSH